MHGSKKVSVAICLRLPLYSVRLTGLIAEDAYKVRMLHVLPPAYSCSTKEYLLLPFKLEFANEMTYYLRYSYVQTHNLLYKIVSTVLSSSCNAFCYNF